MFILDFHSANNILNLFQHPTQSVVSFALLWMAAIQGVMILLIQWSFTIILMDCTARNEIADIIFWFHFMWLRWICVFTIPYCFILGISDLSDIYKKECYAGMYNKDSRKYGFYPATRCLKIKGQFGNSHIWYYIYCVVKYFYP